MKILLAVLLFLVLPLKVSAHTIEHSKTIGAVLHVDPNDSPVAREESNIYIDFKDKTNRFKLADCNCSISFIHDEIIVYSTPLHAPDQGDNVAHLPYTFSEPGVYRIVVHGEPITGMNFDTFTLSYPVRVTPNTDSTPQQPQPIKYWWILSIPLLVVGGVVGKRLSAKREKRGNNRRKSS